MVRLALLWHMHQPYYEDLATGEHILPWVRLHAIKDYWGMVAMLEAFPRVHVTFNLVPSLLVQVEAFAANRARDRHLELGLKPAADLTEDSDPPPVEGDRLVTAAALGAAFARHPGPAPAALVVRTLQNGEGPLLAYRGSSPAPYLTRQAAAWLVERGIKHLVLDLPSADRAADGGRLTAHRTFFGLPPGSRKAREAMRPDSSITELAYIAAEIKDGFYLLDLQIPPFLTDAAPSRPLLYSAQPE